MDEILQQLGGLLLNAIPTVVIFVFLYISYRLLVHKPLERALEERHAKTEGAVAKAQADVAAAEAKTSEYEQKIRDAKVAIYKQQEAHRRELMDARAKALAEARAHADAQVKQAKADLDRDAAAARQSLESEADRLAAEVIRAILKPATAAPSPAGGFRS